MARRKGTKAPNLPADTLARARSQAGLSNDNLPESVSEEPVSDMVKVAPRTTTTAVKAKPSSKRIQDAQFERSKKRGELDNQAVKERLLNPTRFPTAADLRVDYTFVVQDLRNMFLLSLALIAFLIVIASVF